MTLEGIKYYLEDPKRWYAFLASRNLLNWMSDEAFLKIDFWLNFGKKLDLKNPKTFNEKMQWLKLYNRRPIFTQMVDKYEVKRYIAETIGQEYVIPTIGMWEDFDDINFDSLPNQFVLKCTHDSGGLVICTDKAKLDIKSAKAKIQKCLKTNYFWRNREWPYKNVKPRIIAEQYMQDDRYERLNVYKIFNFNGEPKIIQSIQGDKTPNETIDYFDTEWNLLKLKQNYPNSQMPLKKPETLEKMLILATKLSAQSTPFIRTDFYEINGKVYFSEITFFSDSGFAKFEPEEWDYTFGSWITLQDKSIS